MEQCIGPLDIAAARQRQAFQLAQPEITGEFLKTVLNRIVGEQRLTLAQQPLDRRDRGPRLLRADRRGVGIGHGPSILPRRQGAGPCLEEHHSSSGVADAVAPGQTSVALTMFDALAMLPEAATWELDTLLISSVVVSVQ